MAIKYTTLEGDEVIRNIHRIWILSIIDTATRVILGYHISLNKEYTSTDVLHCIYNAVFPHQKKEFTIPGFETQEGIGFHSDEIPETCFAIWDEICFDNAKANLAYQVKEKLKLLLGCRINVGPVGTPTRRPFIEKFFHILEENGFHRIVSTTGSSPKDPRRQDAEHKAVKYLITPDEVEQLTEVLIAERNRAPQKGLGHISSLEAMKQRINRGMSFRVLEEKYRDGYDFFTIEADRTIRGDSKTGKRPYIHYEGVDYKNDLLSEAFNLIGIKLRLVVNVEDVRYLRGYLPDGSEIGLLKAKGKWGIKKHSLRMRKAINKLTLDNNIHISVDSDPIELYHNHLNNKSRTNKNARNKLASLNKIQNEVLRDSSQINTEVEVENGNNVDKIIHQTKKKNSKRKVNERIFFNS